MKDLLPTSSLIAQFSAAFSAGLKRIAEAAELYVVAIDNDPRAKEQFIEKFRDKIPASMWSQIEKVGRRELHAQILFGAVPNAKHIRLLPFAQQKRFIETKDTVALVTPKGGVMKARPVDLKPEQAARVFDKRRVRTVKEQVDYIEKVEAKAAAPAVKKRYTIINNSVHFWHNTILSKSELQDILAELK